MPKVLLCIITILLSINIYAKRDNDEETTQMRSYPGGKCYMMRLYLKDKNGTRGTFANPQAFLSQKAIDRRAAQGCRIDSTDLPISDLYIDNIKVEGVEIITKSKWNNTLVIKDNSLKHLKQFAKLPFVRDSRLVWRSPDSINIAKHTRTHFRENLKLYDDLDNSDYGIAWKQNSILNIEQLHKRGYRGHGMTIAIIDGGFMNVDKIPAFKNSRIVNTADFTYPRCTNIYSETDHGTKVLSTMATNDPRVYVGTAPEAHYILLRSEDTEAENPVEEDYWAAAAEYADSIGVDILTSSLGYHAFDSEDMNYKYFDLDGHTALISNTASMMAQKGIVCVCSAGNEGMSSWKKINVPADADNILTVGAITDNGVNAAFSSVGPTADGRIKPDLMACGSPAAVITGRGTLLKDIGTSFAAPQVAGAVACYWQDNHKMTALEVINAIRKMGSNASTPDNIYGYGVPEF